MELEVMERIFADFAERSGCVSRLWLFGSRVPESGKIPRPDSDLDVAVELLPQRDDPLAVLLFEMPRWVRLLRRNGIPYRVRFSLFPGDGPSAASSIVSTAVAQYGRLVFCHAQHQNAATEEK